MLITYSSLPASFSMSYRLPAPQLHPGSAMMSTFKPAQLAGCFEIQPNIVEDNRGRFVKVFHADTFAEMGLATEFSEEYYSHSKLGVIRGMHFQTPPAELTKLVYCVTGTVFDVLLDLRVGSPTFGQTETFTLSAAQGNYLYIPKGVAHGFCVTSASATLVYKVTNVYAPEYDAGLLWSSINVDWPIATPILSSRDANFMPLSQFQSPFIYE